MNVAGKSTRFSRDVPIDFFSRTDPTIDRVRRNRIIIGEGKTKKNTAVSQYRRNSSGVNRDVVDAGVLLNQHAF